MTPVRITPTHSIHVDPPAALSKKRGRVRIQTHASQVGHGISLSLIDGHYGVDVRLAPTDIPRLLELLTQAIADDANIPLKESHSA